MNCARRCAKKALDTGDACTDHRRIDPRKICPSRRTRVAADREGFFLDDAVTWAGRPELFAPELTAEWEFKLAQMEHGKLKREQFMREIVKMTKHIVAQAKNYESDTIPGDFATLTRDVQNAAARCTRTTRSFNVRPATSACGKSSPADSSKRPKPTHCSNIARSARSRDSAARSGARSPLR